MSGNERKESEGRGSIYAYSALFIQNFFVRSEERVYLSIRKKM